jgi:hypothetical protein
MDNEKDLLASLVKTYGMKRILEDLIDIVCSKNYDNETYLTQLKKNLEESLRSYEDRYGS